MEIRCDATIPFPRPLVYETYRDRLLELVPYLPNIRNIEVRERAQQGNVLRVVNTWHGGADIPSIARAFLSDSMLSWTDHAVWYAADFKADWRVEPHSFPEAVTSIGTTSYHLVQEGTRIEIRGDLSIDGTKVRGLPKLLAGRMGRAVEEFVVKLIRQNLLDVSKGVERYFRDGAKAPT
ncbi:MAG: hypothetical protein MUF54_16250 [Polyangiaceae bacterium]|nr:hypothetical protein [Polyangiaceae bacterium]